MNIAYGIKGKTAEKKHMAGENMEQREERTGKGAMRNNSIMREKTENYEK